MNWIILFIFMAILVYVMKWLHSELKEAKLANKEAADERKEILKSLKNIEENVIGLDKALHPIEKRHFR